MDFKYLTKHLTRIIKLRTILAPDFLYVLHEPFKTHFAFRKFRAKILFPQILRGGKTAYNDVLAVA